MNDEIKEILDYIDDRIIPNEKWNKIKDYITNLQDERHQLLDYKSRCEKAVKLLNETCHSDCDYSIAHVLVLEAIDILTGGDKE